MGCTFFSFCFFGALHSKIVQFGSAVGAHGCLAEALLEEGLGEAVPWFLLGRLLVWFLLRHWLQDVVHRPLLSEASRPKVLHPFP